MNRHGRVVVDDEYRAAVVQVRTQQHTYGPKRIAHDLRARFLSADGATVWRVLHQAIKAGVELVLAAFW